MRQALGKWGVGGLLLIALSMGGCSNADMLGGEAPDETIISGTPTWENGVGEIIQNKCATCHVVPATDYTPASIRSYTLNLTLYAGDNSTVRGADTLGSWITGGILEQPMGSVRQMPLDYATPLTDREIGYLKDWAANGVPRS